MATVEFVKVKRSQEESARNAVFFERDFVHRQVVDEDWPGGEVLIADDAVHTVVKTPAVMAAIRINRLDLVEDAGERVVDEDEIEATDAARKLAVGAGVDLALVPPSGAQGQVVKRDVENYIQRLKDAR